jgi:hypothetical protein
MAPMTYRNFLCKASRVSAYTDVSCTHRNFHSSAFLYFQLPSFHPQSCCLLREFQIRFGSARPCVRDKQRVVKKKKDEGRTTVEGHRKLTT